MELLKNYYPDYYFETSPRKFQRKLRICFCFENTFLAKYAVENDGKMSNKKEGKKSITELSDKELDELTEEFIKRKEEESGKPRRFVKEF